MTQTVIRTTQCDVKRCTASESVPNEQPPGGGWAFLHLKVEGDRDVFKNVCPEHARKILDFFLE